MSNSAPQPPRLLDQVRAAVRALHYSPRTEDAYVGWIRRFILFHGKRHPREMGTAEVERYLTYLATDGHVAASTQNQALGALLFLYRHVLRLPLEGSISSVRAKRPQHMPEVPSHEEVGKVLSAMGGSTLLVAGLLYGSGLRLQEAISLRIKDLDFQRGEINVRSGKGGKDRVTMLPSSLQGHLQLQIAEVRRVHERDLAAGNGQAPLPYALARKLPGASREWAWQFVFPSSAISRNRESGLLCRHHMSPATIQKAVHVAAARAEIARRVTCHGLRHAFATQLLKNGYDIRTVQELLGHSSVQTTMIYTHVLNRGGLAVRSPLDGS